MNKTTRRSFLKRTGTLAGVIGTASLGGGIGILSASKGKTNVRIESVSYGFEEYSYRTPNKFGGKVVDSSTLLTVRCTVRTVAGQVAQGFGVMPLGNSYSFPSKKMSYAETLSVMKVLIGEIASITRRYREFGHPVDINWALSPLYHRAAAELSKRTHLAEPIPKLCTLVSASAFDSALHDAFGKAHNLNCYQTYGPEFMDHDLSYYLGAEYKGEYPSQYIQKDPKLRMPLCHMVSAADPLDPSDLTKRINDGLPETLTEWIGHNGLSYLKIKLNGDDLKWDVERLMQVEKVTAEAQKKRGVHRWAYTLDFNAKCPNADYYLGFLRQAKEKTPAGFARLEYVEQPTSRDLKAHPENKLHEAAKLCPVVIDESLTDVESLFQAREMGYTGAAIKAPKGLSNMLLIASAAAKHKIFVCGGDMSCPGASLIQTAGLGARVRGITSIEANARQFVPAANKSWEPRFPGMFRITDGMLHTAELTQPGLGVPEG